MSVTPTGSAQLTRYRWNICHSLRLLNAMMNELCLIYCVTSWGWLGRTMGHRFLSVTCGGRDGWAVCTEKMFPTWGLGHWLHIAAWHLCKRNRKFVICCLCKREKRNIVSAELTLVTQWFYFVEMVKSCWNMYVLLEITLLPEMLLFGIKYMLGL